MFGRMPLGWLCSALLCWAAAPAEIVPEGTFRFAILGDRTGRAVPGVYEQAWRDAAAIHPAFFLTVGDAIEGGSLDTASAEWNFVRRVWPRGVPVHHVAGNHDIWDAASERLFVQATGNKPFYSFDFRQAHFIVLDNSRTAALAPDQLSFLKEDLERNRAKSPVFVLFHRAFWLIPLKLGAEEIALQKVLSGSNVCCIISGHGHQFQSVTSDGRLYLEVGSSGANVERAADSGLGYPDGWFYQYVSVTVSGNSVDFEVHELGSPYGESRVRNIHAGGPAK